VYHNNIKESRSSIEGYQINSEEYQMHGVIAEDSCKPNPKSLPPKQHQLVVSILLVNYY